MSTNVGSIHYDLGLDTSKFDAATKRVQGKLDDFGNTVNRAFKIAGVAAVGFGVSSVKAYMESENALTQLNTVLKSTGGIAGVTADQAIKLSQSLQNVTKYSDEDVLSAENLLLTFTNINKSIFPETTKIVLDMSTALGQDLKSSAIQVGKALQDPILGVTALRRVGVNFNQAQEDVIKNLVETGRQAEAQAYILKELQREFGGSAQAAGGTFAGQLTILKNKFDDVQEGIGKIILEALNPFMGKIAEFVNKSGPALQQKLQDLVKNFSTFVSNSQNAIKSGNWDEPIQLMMNKLATGIIAGLPRMIEIAIPAIIVIGPKIINALISGIINAAIQHPLDFLQLLLVLGFIPEKVIFALVGVLGRIPIVGSVIEWMIKGFTVAAQFLFAPVRALFGSIIRGAVDGMREALGPIVNFGAEIWARIAGGTNSILGTVYGFFRTIGRNITQFLIQGAQELIGSFVGTIRYVIGTPISAAYDAARAFYGVGRNIISGLIQGVKDMAGALVNAVKGVVGNAIDGAKRLLHIKSPSLVFADIGKNMVAGMSMGINQNAHDVHKSIVDLTNSSIAGASYSTTINGPIHVGSKGDADYLLRRLDRNLTLETMGVSPV